MRFACMARDYNTIEDCGRFAGRCVGAGLRPTLDGAKPPSPHARPDLRRYTIFSPTLFACVKSNR